MNSKVRDLVFMALYAALFAVLDIISNEFIPFLQMPEGGSIGISTIVLLVASYHLGWKKAVVAGLVSVLIQFVTGPMYIANLLGFFFDYLFAFSIYGIACLFPRSALPPEHLCSVLSFLLNQIFPNFVQNAVLSVFSVCRRFS